MLSCAVLFELDAHRKKGYDPRQTNYFDEHSERFKYYEFELVRKSLASHVRRFAVGVERTDGDVHRGDGRVFEIFGPICVLINFCRNFRDHPENATKNFNPGNLKQLAIFYNS